MRAPNRSGACPEPSTDDTVPGGRCRLIVQRRVGTVVIGRGNGGERLCALRWLTWSALWVIVAVVLWYLADWILMADRGLDLGDEALYLLAADARSPTAAFVFPFGLHTRPIYNLVGGDVAAFRTAGAVVLAEVCLWVGMSAARLMGAARDRAD